MTIEFVSATRMTREEFWEKSALGRSLLRIDASDHDRWVARVAFENRRGLPEVFNERIQAASEHDILVFVHDDVWIDDFFICDHLEEALHEFAVVGVAGNRRRVPRQPAWAFVRLTDEFVWDEPANLCGAIAHGPGPFGEVSRFGPTFEECELLDGVFIATRRTTLRERAVLFDTRFKFDFYDVDFCRRARERELRIGCWPIALTHQSQGLFGSASWHAGYAAYLEKWRD
jgi:GT2 family glycosyltransferase